MYYIRRALDSVYAYWSFSDLFPRLLFIAGFLGVVLLLVNVPKSVGLGLIGVCAALIASSTAAGGGVLFVPVFSHMELSAATVISTSILIQCFGMSSGSIRWTIRLRSNPDLYQRHIHNLKWFSIATVLGALAGVYAKRLIELDFELLFSVLSAVFAILLLIQTRLSMRDRQLFELSDFSTKLVVSVVAFGGAMLTPFISVGVGELVAIVLMLLGHNTAVAVATGVCLAALSLLACMPFEIIAGQYDRSLLIVIAPGAIIGGAFAYKITESLGPVRLKLFFAVYALIVAAVMYNK